MLKLALISMLAFVVLQIASNGLASEVSEAALPPKAPPNKAQAKLPAQNDQYLPPLNNWADVAAIAQKQQVPIVLMVSLKGCKFCKSVRQAHLLPLLAQEQATPRAIVRQIEVTGTEAFTDAEGEVTSHLKFAQKLGAKVAPTVYFFNAKGEQVAAPLEGALLPEFYGAYLDDALAQATSKIRDSTLK